MSDRAKLTFANLAAMMLPQQVGYSLAIVILTALFCLAIDLTKQAFVQKYLGPCRVRLLLAARTVLSLPRC